MQTDTVSIFYVNAVLQRARQSGVDPAPFLNAMGLSAAQLENPSTRIPSRQYVQLAMELVWATGDEFLRYDGKCRTKPGTFALMCHAVIHSKNLKQAILRCFRFYGLFQIDVRFRLKRFHNEAVITVECVDTQADRDHTTTDSCLLLMHRFFSWLIGQHLELTHVSLNAAPAFMKDEYQRLFRSHVRFDKPYNGLHFERRLLDMPVRQTRQSLDQFLRNAADSLVVMPDHSITSRIRRLMGTDASVPMPDFETVARMLATNTQTLRRHLRAEGTSFQTVKDTIRRDVAIQYLHGTHYSIHEIAELVGYSESSAFHRAFKKWTGLTPGDYRLNP